MALIDPCRSNSLCRTRINLRHREPRSVGWFDVNSPSPRNGRRATKRGLDKGRHREGVGDALTGFRSAQSMVVVVGRKGYTTLKKPIPLEGPADTTIPSEPT